MNRQPFEKPPRWWSPKLSPRWVRFWRPLRMRKQLNKQRLLEVEVRGLEHVRQSVAGGQGVLITPNHSSHADCHAIYTAADQLGYPFYVMIAWQNFVRDGRLKCLVLRHHGGFSVDREGTDMRAFRQAVAILQSQQNPLVIFPEGDVYHTNDRITPFREGPAAMALLAARKRARPVVCIPCGIKYRYLEDPTRELLQTMDELERAIFWRPRTDLSLDRRIYHFAEGVLALKEIEFLGHTCSGPVRKRVADLMEFILGRIEARYALDSSKVTVPERVKLLRKHVIERLADLPDDDERRKQCREDLDDVFLVVQAFSYPGDYVEERPSVERMAETIDKFEEDVLGVKTATIRGARAATVTFGEPIPVDSGKGKKTAAKTLTRTMEERVQGLLDGECDNPQAG
ncbi:MAG: 1-acyl-sn-glycerol-3-phosphate acyltransferase [Planctomycetes bacterium]|nr:1-acyl-sn-glycerol-3-phosphate acyltransferase [Planctomycetota bacterium]